MGKSKSKMKLHCDLATILAIGCSVLALWFRLSFECICSMLYIRFRIKLKSNAPTIKWDTLKVDERQMLHWTLASSAPHSPWNAIRNATFGKYFESEKHQHLHAYYHCRCTTAQPAHGSVHETRKKLIDEKRNEQMCISWNFISRTSMKYFVLFSFAASFMWLLYVFIAM